METLPHTGQNFRWSHENSLTGEIWTGKKEILTGEAKDMKR